MRRKQEDLFSSKIFTPPQIWRIPSVFFATLAINVLGLALPIVILQVYDRIIPNQAVETFLFLIIGMLVVIILDTGLRSFRTMLLSWEGAKFDHRESLKALSIILDADSSDFESKPSGHFLDKMHALEQVQEFYSGQSILLLLDFPFVLIYMTLIWFIAGYLLFIPISLLLVFLIISFITGRRLQKALNNRHKTEDRRQNFIIETLNGIHTIKSMAMESFMLRRYEKLQSSSAESVFELSRVNSVVQGIGASFSQLAVIIFVSIGSIYVIQGSLSIGALAASTMLSNRVLQPGLKAMGLWTQFQSVRMAREKVDDLFSLKQEDSGSLTHQEGIKGGIELSHVSFQYPSQKENQEALLLDDISLKIKPGEAIAITGSNGVGKSTLIKLLSGFVHPTEGQILIDNEPLREYNLEYLRAQIAIIPQKGILFEGTILENMTLYREEKAIDQAIELAKQLGLDEIIARLPNGLDTQIGGSSVGVLSEGVSQKVIMVRSLVGYPPIILFDDANANFDIKNDNKLHSVMKELVGKRTMIIVSHRPSFMRLCDRQFEIKEGKLNDITEQFASFKPKPSVKTAAKVS